MENYLLFALLGLGTGALIAGLALSIVLTYRGSGIINFAAGAVAMVAGYTFWSLQAGTYGAAFGRASAFVITMIVSLGAGLLLELIAFRPLRSATPLAKLVASLGLFLLFQAAMLLAFGSDPKPVVSILPGGTVTIFNVRAPIENFVLAGIVIAMAAVLTGIYRWSRFGLATRAASENEVAGMLAGLSPNRLAMANTLLASVVAGAVGVLAAPLTQLDAVTLPLQVVPALAAALIARFTSFAIACVAGLAIGAIENILYYVSTLSWFPQDHGAPLPGVEALLVFLIMVVAVWWRGASLPGRGELIEKRLPFAPRPERIIRPALIAGAVGCVALIVLPYDFRQALVNSIIAAVLVLSLIVMTGFVGQISIVQLALAGIAGLVMSHLALDAGIGFPAGPLIAAIVATIVGVLIAIPALRVRGVSLVVITIAAALAIEQFVFANTTWGGGTRGARVPRPELFGIDLGSDASFRGLDGKLPSPILGFVVLVVAVLLCLLVANVRRSNLGQRMLAVRSNERAAAAAGINVRNTKLAAFGIASLIAGFAGALYAYNFGSVSPDRFDALTALTLIAFAYIGGITMISGAILAGLMTTEGVFPHAFEQWFGISGTWTVLFAGIALLFNLVLYPEGVAGATYRKKQAKLKRAQAGRRPPPGGRVAQRLSRWRGTEATTSVAKQ